MELYLARNETMLSKMERYNVQEKQKKNGGKIAQEKKHKKKIKRKKTWKKKEEKHEKHGKKYKKEKN